MNRLSTLSFRILVACLSLVVFPLIINTFYLVEKDYRNEIEDNLITLEMIGKNSQEEFLFWKWLSDKNLQVVSQLSLSEEKVQMIAKEELLQAFFFLRFQPDGSTVCQYSLDAKRIGKRDLFSKELSTLKEAETLFFTSYDPFLRKETLYAARKAGESGILVQGFSLQFLIDRLQQSYLPFYSDRMAVVDNHGKVLATTSPNFSLDRSLIFTEEDLKGERQELKKTDKEYLALKVPLFLPTLSLYIDVSKTEIRNRVIQERAAQSLVLLLLILSVGGALVWVMTRKMSRPLHSLYDVMKEVGEGNSDARYEKQWMGFEVNAVGDHFNQTVEKLVFHVKQADEERLRKEVLQKEMKIAREIQQSLFPKELTAIPSVEVAARFSPAKEVTGDFYDLFADEGKLMMVVADAAGKGLSSSLYALTVRSLLRSSYYEKREVAAALEATNQLFCYDTKESGDFVTLWMALFDSASKRLTYSSCGHNPGVLIRKDREIEELTTRGMALGVSANEKISIAQVDLHAGDLLFLYTDGLVEAHNNQDELFGKQRLLAFLHSHRERAPELLLQELIQEIKQFSNGRELHDDITLLALRIV